jgi:hypothetical protein
MKVKKYMKYGSYWATVREIAPAARRTRETPGSSPVETDPEPENGFMPLFPGVTRIRARLEGNKKRQRLGFVDSD